MSVDNVDTHFFLNNLKEFCFFNVFLYLCRSKNNDNVCFSESIKVKIRKRISSLAIHIRSAH